MNESLLTKINRAQNACLGVGIVALAFSLAGAFLNPRQFFFSYLFAILFWLGLALGCLAVAMIHQLTGGRWGYPTRRIFEAGFLTLPLMFTLFIPLFFGLNALYPWAREAAITRQRFFGGWAYDSSGGYTLRQLLFFVLWIWIAAKLRQFSLEQDRTEDAAPTCRARTLSGPGIVLCGLAGTFASIDWLVSLDPGWSSTLFGVIILTGQVLSAFAFGIVLLGLFRHEPPLASALTELHFHHLGNLLLTFILFWTYVSFGQLLIIYSGDLPRELGWYLRRIAGGWKVVVASLALFNFFVPFSLLLFQRNKQRAAILVWIAALVLGTQLIHTYWLVMPALHPNGISPSWLDVTAPLGVGGLWIAVFLHRLKEAPLLPLHDPGKQFAFAYAEP